MSVLGIVLFGIITVLFAGIAKITEKDYNLPQSTSVINYFSASYNISNVYDWFSIYIFS